MTNANQFGAMLRSRRQAMGLTQAQVAERARVSRESVSRLEAGRDNARLSLALGVLAALEAHVSFSEEQPMSAESRDILDAVFGTGEL